MLKNFLAQPEEVLISQASSSTHTMYRVTEFILCQLKL